MKSPGTGINNQNKALMNDSFISACRDYAYLINRCYPERGALKLVGDRYQMTRDQRTVLYRGISSVERSALRSSRLVEKIDGKRIAIDGYNVLFSLLNYRLGRFTFISTDNVLRDAGSLHGRLKDENMFLDCTRLMGEFLVAMQPAEVTVFLDSPVSHSERHARIIGDVLRQNNLTGTCQIIRSADYALKHYSHDVIATSDSIIIEIAGRPVIDLPRMLLEKQYGADLVRISAMI
jgi:hypothetical protein